MGLGSIGGLNATQHLIDFSNAANDAIKAVSQAKMNDPVHMAKVVDNPDDHPELAIILLQIHKIKEDIEMVRNFFDDVKNELELKLAITDNHLPGTVWKGLSGTYGMSTATTEHIYEKDGKGNYQHVLRHTVTVKGKNSKDDVVYYCDCTMQQVEVKK